MEKRCCRCKLVLPVKMFHRCKSTADGLYSLCKDCSRENVARWRKEHPERTKELRRREYHRNIENYRDHYRENRQRYLDRARRWYEINKEQEAK